MIGETYISDWENPCVFLPIQLSELSGNIDMASHFVSRHLIAADLDSTQLKKYGNVYTLQGISASISEYQVRVSWFTLSYNCQLIIVIITTVVPLFQWLPSGGQ